MGLILSLIIPLVFLAAMIGIPVWFIFGVLKKQETETIVYSPEEVTQRLRKGFFLSVWGVELMFGTVLSFALLFCDIPSAIASAVPSISFMVGVIMLFVGRVQVGTMTRYLNFCNRDRTELEEWVLNRMKQVEGAAAKVTRANAITKLTPGVTDDMLAALNSSGTIAGFWAVASIYTGRKNLKKHWPLVSITLLILISVLFTIIT